MSKEYNKKVIQCKKNVIDQLEKLYTSCNDKIGKNSVWAMKQNITNPCNNCLSCDFFFLNSERNKK